MKKLALFYLAYAVVVGGLLYLLILVGTQAAHSSAEANIALIFGLLPPLPMLIVGYGLRRGWKYGRQLALALPVAMGLVVALVWAKPAPTRAAPQSVSLAFNAAMSQLYFLPGATLLGLCVLGDALRERRR